MCEEASGAPNWTRHFLILSLGFILLQPLVVQALLDVVKALQL